MAKKKNKIPLELDEVRHILIGSLTEGVMRLRATLIMLSDGDVGVYYEKRIRNVEQMITIIDSKIIALASAKSLKELDEIINIDAADKLVHALKGL